MALPIEDYALIGDRQHRRPGRPQRLDRLALPAPLRLRRLLRGAARHRRARPLAAVPRGRLRVEPSLRRRLRRCWRRRSPPPPASSTLARPDAARRRPGRRGPPGHRRRAARSGCATSGWSASTTARSGRGCAARRSAARRSSPRSAGPTSWSCAGPGCRWRPTTGTPTSSTSREGDELIFSTTWVPSHVDLDDLGDLTDRIAQHHRRRRGAGPTRCPTDVPHADVVRRSLLTLRLLTHEADRRHRRRADHLAARGLRRRAQLGLPLLLAARRRPDPRVADPAPATPTRRGSGGDWLLRAVAGDPEDLQIMYAVDGARRLPERTLDHLPGYAGLAPGADRQRRRRPAPDRRARRGDDRPRARPRRAGLRATRTPGPCSARWSTTSPTTWQRARQRPVGDPRRAARTSPTPG